MHEVDVAVYRHEVLREVAWNAAEGLAATAPRPTVPAQAGKRGMKQILALSHAERIVWVTGWRQAEERALSQLAGTSGLACARLDPRSEVIQLVTYDGEHLGHVRRDGTGGPEGAWVAVRKDSGSPIGRFGSALTGAEGIARACGIQMPEQI
jgi:hypothetical protein